MPRWWGLIRRALIGASLGLAALGASRADNPGPTPVPLLSDAQDRLLPPVQDATIEARGRASALYAATLTDDPAGSAETILSRLRQVVSLDPHFTDAQIRVANLLLQSGRFEDALAQLKSALATNPNSVTIEAALAYTERLRGEGDDAVRLATSVLKRDPGQAVAMRVLLEVALAQGDLAGAVVHIEDILKAGGERVPASSWLTLARLYLEVAQSNRQGPGVDVLQRTRLPIIEQAAAKAPSDVDTLVLLAHAYRDLGRKFDALHTLRQALELQPSKVDLLTDCGELEAELGDKTEAIRHDETAYILRPGLTGLRESLGLLYLDTGRFVEASALFEQALGESPGDTRLEIDLGLAYEGAHHPQQARTCFQQVFSTVACPPEAYLRLASFQREHAEPKEAADTLASAQAHFPLSAAVRLYQGIQYRAEKKYDQALACLTQARALAGGGEAETIGPASYLETAETLDLAGRSGQVEPVLKEGLEKYPDNPDIINELAWCWADRDTHLPEALTLSSRAVRLAPDSGPIQDTQGWVYFQLGRAKEALPYLQRAALLTDNDPMVLQHLGDAYLRLGLRRQAVAAWSRALQKDPRNGDLANRIDAALAQAKNAHSRPAP